MTKITGAVRSVCDLVYRHQLSEISASTANMVVLGGGGMGKSSVLQWLADDMSARFIDGRELDTAGGRLDDAISDLQRDQPSAVIIDDLDYLLNEERSSLDAVQTLIDKIDRLRAELTQHQKRMIVGSTSPISRFLRSPFSQFWSDIETRFKQETLFPWPVGWREGLHAETCERFRAYGEGCAAAVVSVSGGHPALVSASFEILREYTVSEAKRVTPDWLMFLAQGVGRIGLSPIEKAFHDLQRSAHLTDRAALEHLTVLVQNDGEGPPPKAPQVLRALELCGLAYGDPASGVCRIPGEVVLRFLEGELPATDSEEGISQVRVTARGTDEGSLFVGPADREIPLSKGLWHLVNKLFEARGDVVPLDDLVMALNLESHKPLYSIVQRLDQKAKEAHLDRIIENVRGQGYRLNRSIQWRG